MWRLEVGDSADFIKRQAEQSGHKIPDRIANPPYLNPVLHFYYDAFFDLTFDRQIGFSLGPIPFTAILAYSKHYGLDIEMEMDLIEFIRGMDIEYLKFMEKKNRVSKKTV